MHFALLLLDLIKSAKVLIMKWLWKNANNKHLLWGKAIRANYEGEKRWMAKEVISPYAVNLWRSTRALWDEF